MKTPYLLLRAKRLCALIVVMPLFGCATSSLTWIDSDILLISKEYPTVMTHEGPRKLPGGACLSIRLIGTKNEYNPGEFYIGSYCQTQRNAIALITRDYKGSIKVDRANKQVSVRLFYYTGSAFELNGDYTYK
jgi:hypothetical protein